METKGTGNLDRGRPDMGGEKNKVENKTNGNERIGGREGKGGDRRIMD